jgi:hypothetical protein
MFIVGIALGVCAGVAGVLAVQALVEHKRYGTVAGEDVRALSAQTQRLIDQVLAEIRKLTMHS